MNDKIYIKIIRDYDHEKIESAIKKINKVMEKLKITDTKIDNGYSGTKFNQLLDINTSGYIRRYRLDLLPEADKNRILSQEGLRIRMKTIKEYEILFKK